MSDELDEKFKSDDGVSVIEDPIDGAGGKVKPRRGDLKIKADADQEKKLKEDEDQDLSFESIFEGTDLSEDFVAKAKLVFEAAVNEESTKKAFAIGESLEEDFQERLQSTVTESMEELVENLDAYLDYIVEEWMTENEVAVESGIKVEIAESLMSGLKNLFVEHNMEVTEEDSNLLEAAQAKLDETTEYANKALDMLIAIKEENAELKSKIVFNEISEGLTDIQKDRLSVLSERLNFEDADEYAKDLSVLKESFFSKKSVLREDLTKEEEPLLEEVKAKKSADSTINALVEAFNRKQATQYR